MLYQLTSITGTGWNMCHAIALNFIRAGARVRLNAELPVPSCATPIFDSANGGRGEEVHGA